MRQLRRARANTAEVDMTPALDIVFILLIFFIVTATFITESAMDMEPPPRVEGGGDPVPTMLIQIGNDDLVTLDGELTLISSLKGKIQRIRAETPGTALIVQAAPQARAGTVMLVRDAAYSAGIADGVNVVLAER